MKPLAHRLRPTKFSQIVGQDHLVGPNGILTKMIEQEKLFSFILYGSPGIGKTTIASIFAAHFSLNVFQFNAANDTKQKLKEIAEGTKYYDTTIVIIDEIHRMKKDIQDFLLPYVEDGSFTIIGLTTINPYQAINPAIRSRCQIYRMNEIKTADIEQLLRQTVKHETEFQTMKLDDDVYSYLANASGSDVRTALNMLDSLLLISDTGTVTVNQAVTLVGKPSLRLDKSDDNYYDCLSALQKSIRGSDVDAALHYLARLVTLEDLEILTRRLLVIAYEDIGLGNPQIGPRAYAACQAAKQLGFPEARIPLAALIVDMALSPKSNSACIGIEAALQDYESGVVGAIPKNILNRELKKNPELYLYPHDYPDAYVVQQYLPDNLLGKSYYQPKETGNYERAFKARYEELNRRKQEKSKS